MKVFNIVGRVQSVRQSLDPILMLIVTHEGVWSLPTLEQWFPLENASEFQVNAPQ